MKRIARQLIDGESYEPSKNYTGIDTSEPYKVYKSENGVPEGYEDITDSLVNVDAFYMQAGADYITMRDICRSFTIGAGGFNSLSNEDKEVAKNHIAINEAEQLEVESVIGYILMTEVVPSNPASPTALELAEAQDLYLDYKSQQVNLSSVAAHERAYEDGAISRALLKIVMKHVAQSEMKDLLDNVEAFLPDYTTIAWFGTPYGDPRVGIADYILSTGSYAPDGGLYTFSTNAPDTATNAEVEAYKSARKEAFKEYLFE